MNARHRLALAVAVAAALVGAQVSRAQSTSYTLQHTNSIDLSSLFFGSGATTPASDYGWNALSVAFDGTNAYVGGYNTGAATGNVGIVKISDVLGASPTVGGLASTIYASPSSRGIDSLAYDPVSGRVYMGADTGTAATSMIRRIQGDGTIDWTVTNPGTVRPMAMAIDPVGDNGSPSVAFLNQNSGRQLSLRTSDGSQIFTISGGANPGPILLGSPTNIGNAWRAEAFDAAGNVIVAEEDGVLFGVRNATNQFKTLQGAVGNTSPIAVKPVTVNNVGNGVAALEGLATTSTLVAFSARVNPSVSGTPNYSLSLEDNPTLVANPPSSWPINRGTMDQTGLDSRYVQIRNNDGTQTGLSQIQLTGAEDGIGGTGFRSELKNFATGKDANGLPVLAVVSYIENRLDIYQTEPTYLADADGAWSDTSKWLAGVSPNSATLNARFAPTTGARTITVDGAPVTKDLKIDSANPYTFTGNALTISGPAGQNGNVQVLQGSHTIQNALNLPKTTVIQVAQAASTLTITGPVAGSGGISKTGLGTLTLTNGGTVGGALGVTGGTLNVNGSLSNVARLSGAGTPGAPATINVNGTVALVQNGTSAGTSKLSADTALNIGAAGKLDLNDNDAVIDYSATSPMDAIRTYLFNGRNGGSWDGAGGIVSTAAASQANGVTGIGTYEASLFPAMTSFSGQPVTASSVLLKYTYYGDTNADGVVDADDYANVDRGFANNVADAHWTDGDFNYDGVVNSADYFLMDKAYGVQTGALSPDLLSEREAQFGSDYVAALTAAVPEPATLVGCGVVSLVVVGRRRGRA